MEPKCAGTNPLVAGTIYAPLDALAAFAVGFLAFTQLSGLKLANPSRVTFR